MIVPVVLLIIVLILFTTFRSLAIAGLVYANIPFALMGGVLALFISGEYLICPSLSWLYCIVGRRRAQWCSDAFALPKY